MVDPMTRYPTATLWRHRVSALGLGGREPVGLLKDAARWTVSQKFHHRQELVSRGLNHRRRE
eukprot:scaffold90459_cov34-Tisochrysis_lutea.AAC.2